MAGEQFAKALGTDTGNIEYQARFAAAKGLAEIFSEDRIKRINFENGNYDVGHLEETLRDSADELRERAQELMESYTDTEGELRELSRGNLHEIEKEFYDLKLDELTDFYEIIEKAADSADDGPARNGRQAGRHCQEARRCTEDPG